MTDISNHIKHFPEIKMLGDDFALIKKIEQQQSEYRFYRQWMVQPLALISVGAPLFYAVFWPVIEYSIYVQLNYDWEWWLWHVVALAISLSVGLIWLQIHRFVFSQEFECQKMIEELRSKNYNNPFLKFFFLGRQGLWTSLKPIPKEEFDEFARRSRHLGVYEIWETWVKTGVPRYCDFEQLEKWSYRHNFFVGESTQSK